MFCFFKKCPHHTFYTTLSQARKEGQKATTFPDPRIPERIGIALRIPECVFLISEGLFGKDHGRVGVHRQSNSVGQVHVLKPVVIDLCGREREGEGRGWRETETETETERGTDRDGEGEREPETETERDRERNGQGWSERRGRGRESERETDRQTDRNRESQREKQTAMKRQREGGRET